MASLLARQQTGKGQRVDLSLLECQLASLVNIGSNYLISGQEANRMGTGHASIVPYQVFDTYNGHIMIGAGNDSQFAELCRILEMPQLAVDPRFATNSVRVANRTELVSLLQRRFNQHSTAEWMERLAGSKIPAGPVNNIAQTFQLPQLAHQQMIRSINHPVIGPIRMVGPPVKYSHSHTSIRLPPPLLGEHTSQVLQEWLGLDERQIANMQQSGVIPKL
jgi:succinate--hydroxymethylglutarate CoA-transferase